MIYEYLFILKCLFVWFYMWVCICVCAYVNVSMCQWVCASAFACLNLVCVCDYVCMTLWVCMGLCVNVCIKTFLIKISFIMIYLKQNISLPLKHKVSIWLYHLFFMHLHLYWQESETNCSILLQYNLPAQNIWASTEISSQAPRYQACLSTDTCVITNRVAQNKVPRKTPSYSIREPPSPPFLRIQRAKECWNPLPRVLPHILLEEACCRGRSRARTEIRLRSDTSSVVLPGPAQFDIGGCRSQPPPAGQPAGTSDLRPGALQQGGGCWANMGEKLGIQICKILLLKIALNINIQ